MDRKAARTEENSTFTCETGKVPNILVDIDPEAGGITVGGRALLPALYLNS